jgi:hypothetical protein
MRPRTCSWLWAAGFAAAGALAVAAAEPADAGQIARLIGQLGSARYAEREAATKALNALGEPALVALQQAAQGKDPEVRRRAHVLARQIEARREARTVLVPHRVRLTFKDLSLAEAMAQFAKETGTTLKLHGEIEKASERKITLDTGNATYWEVLERFCAAAGLREVPLPAAPKQQEESRISSMVIIGGAGGARSPTDVMRPAREERPAEILVADGKPPPVPTHVAGALRLRLTPPETEVPNHTRTAGEALFALEAAVDPGLRFQRVVAVRIDRAIDEEGRRLAPLPVALKLPTSTAVRARGGVIVNGVPIDPPDEPNPAARLVPVRLKQPEKPTAKLKELSGVVTVEVQTAPEALVVVEDILKAAGKTVQGARCGVVHVLEAARDENGPVLLKVQVEPASRGLGERPPLPFGGTVIINGRRYNADEDLLSALNFELCDGRGRPYRMVRAIHTGRRAGAAQEYELTWAPGPRQGAPARFVYRDRRTVIIDVPFVLKDVPVP